MSGGVLTPMFDPLKIYAEELDQIRHAGEEVVAAPLVSYFPGREITGPEDNVVTFDIIDGLTVPLWNRAAEGAISGVTLQGSPVSLAAEATRAFQGSIHLVITTRRLLALDIPVDGAATTVRGEWPLESLVELRHDPRLGQHGRLRLTMSDGSMLRLVAGLFFAGRARRVVAAWRSVVGL